MKTLFLTLMFCVTIHLHSFSQTIPSYIPSNGLVAWYPFNGNANDESGNTNNGLIHGVTLTPDRLGNPNAAYSFNGTSNYISVPNSSTLNLSDSASFSFWLLWNGDNNNSGGFSQNIIDKSTSSNIENYRIAIEEPPAAIPNKLGVLSNSVEVHSNSVYTTSVWIHTVVTFQAGTICIYLNGVLDFSGSEILTATNSDSLLIGQSSQTSLHFLFGSLDDIAIWNRALTPCEVKQVYMSGNSGLTLSASMLSYCLSDAQGTLTGSPSGGTWAGAGVTGNSFDPFAADTGLHTVTYTVIDSLGCTISDSLQLMVDVCAGQNPEMDNSFVTLVYPNPSAANGIIYATCSEETSYVALLDISGREIWRRTISANTTSFTFEIFTPGLFLIQTETSDGRVVTNTIVIE